MDQLSAALPDLSRRSLSTAAARLVARDLVERVEAGCFRLTDTGAIAQASGKEIKSGPRGTFQRVKPARQSLNTRLWRAMRRLRKFTIPELLELAARDEKNPKCGARRFLTALERAGYLHRMAKRVPGTALCSNGYLRWSLILDTGPLPPMLRGVRTGYAVLFDPNTGEEHPCRG